jgi:hypothetical protein
LGQDAERYPGAGATGPSNYWTKVAYTIPDTPHASIKPGETGVKMIPINRMVPRSFVTNVTSGSRVTAAAPTTLRGIAFGGDCGVASVDLSIDRGQSWHQTPLGKTEKENMVFANGRRT